MEAEKHVALSVLLFSSGNPEATYLAAGLLQERPSNVSLVLIQGVGDATPSPEVGHVLTELGLDTREWVPQLINAPPTEPVDVGLTICVPT